MESGVHSDIVIDRYSILARSAMAGKAICDCGSGSGTEGCFGPAAYSDNPDAPPAALRVSLGCGNPLAVAAIQPGETVLDLGSGGGLDVLLSARRVGPDGLAYGLDASADMLALAELNAARAGVTNARFLRGRIEDIPLPADYVDVIISNCVINLSADKARVLAEAFRVLRPGGRIGISDVTADQRADPARRAEAEQRVGCLAGALTPQEYRDLLCQAGYAEITISLATPAGPALHSTIIKSVKPAGKTTARGTHRRDD
jgi:SAM-dependent methyltransferase